MKKNGYTIVDIIILITGLTLVFLFTISKLSHAFDNNTDELYQSNLEVYLKQASLYGNTIKDEVSDNESYIITIKTLVDKGYIMSVNKDVLDVRDNSSMLDMKFHLIYDEENDNVYAEIVE